MRGIPNNIVYPKRFFFPLAKNVATIAFLAAQKIHAQ
jgi:hypothetical protein